MADRQNINQTEADDSEDLKRYLFFEASDAERGRLETRFFDDDRLFYELLDLENDLTDRFARNELDENDKRRFESSLEKSPERRVKLANAKSLQSFIDEEKKPAFAVEKEKSSLWQQAANFFGLNAVNFQYATAALLFLLLVGIGFLIYERGRNAQELARLRESENQRIRELENQENTLQEQIKTIEEREQNLQSELAGERGRTDILTEQLMREAAEKARLERDLESLKRQKLTRPPENQRNQPLAPTVATVILAPVGGKGSGGEKVISISQNTRTISATLQIPKESAAETFSVRLNSAPLAENLKANATKSGNKFIRVNFPAKSLLFDMENLLTVTGSDTRRYNYVLRRRK